jgi:hypothetical protein
MAVLRENEAGAKTADLARKHGISEATLYNWKAKYNGMAVSDAKAPVAENIADDVPVFAHYCEPKARRTFTYQLPEKELSGFWI